MVKKEGLARMTDQGQNRDDAKRRPRRWINYAISLFLLVALVVVGTSTYFARQQWWEMYLGYIHR